MNETTLNITIVIAIFFVILAMTQCTREINEQSVIDDCGLNCDNLFREDIDEMECFKFCLNNTKVINNGIK